MRTKILVLGLICLIFLGIMGLYSKSEQLEFINQNSGILLIVFSLIVTLSTVCYVFLTKSLVSETKKMRKAQTAPNIFVSIKSKEEYPGIVDLIVQNIGLGTAYNLRFDVNPDFEYEKGHKFSDIKLIKQGLNYLAPNNKFTDFLTSIIGRIDELGKIATEVSVKYENCLGDSHQQKFLLDFSELFFVRYVGVSSLKKIADNLEKIQKHIHTIMFSSYPRIRVITYTKKDMEEQHFKILEKERLFEEEKKKTKKK